MDGLKAAIAFTLALILLYIFKRFASRRKVHNLLDRFRSNLKNRNHIRRRLNEAISNHLMKDPEIDIEIKMTENETQLREKANIHRARLNRYGKSKMNGILFFQGQRGGVYQITKSGSKKYV